MPKTELSPPPTNLISFLRVGGEQVRFEMPYQLLTWLNSVFNRIGNGPFAVKGYQKASLPSASSNGSISSNPASSLIFVTDDVGGPTLAFSDGTNWLRASDNQIIS